MGTQEQRGFSLIELMVVLSVAALLLGLAVPMFTDAMANSRMSTAINDFGGSLHAARSEALKRGAPVVLCASADAISDHPACSAGTSFDAGWIVFVDRDGNGVPDGDEDLILQRRAPLHHSLRLSAVATDSNLTFDRFGRVGLPSEQSHFDLQICDRRGDRDTGGGIAAGRWLRLSATGWFELHRDRVLVESAANPAGGCG